jgi:hypothetical protein
MNFNMNDPKGTSQIAQENQTDSIKTSAKPKELMSNQELIMKRE